MINCIYDKVEYMYMQSAISTERACMQISHSSKATFEKGKTSMNEGNLTFTERKNQGENFKTGIRKSTLLGKWKHGQIAWCAQSSSGTVSG